MSSKEDLVATNFGTGTKIATVFGVDIKQNDLTVATATALGGIKIGYTADLTNKKYPVQLDGGKAFVQVPWVGSQLPCINPNNLDNIIPLFKKYGSDFTGYPDTFSDATYKLTILDKDEPCEGLSIYVTCKKYATGGRFTYTFNFPTWDDGSIRLLVAEICFDDNLGDGSIYFKNGDKTIYLSHEHDFKMGSDTTRTVFRVNLPIKSGFVLYVDDPESSSAYISSIDRIAKIAHMAGMLIC